MCRYVIFWVCVFSLNGTTWSCPDREVCVSLYIRSERLCLFFSFLLLLRPALDGDSSLTLPWLDTLDELCELKWVGTWRASPPWEANVALQPPTTHCRNTHHSQSTHMMQSDFRLTELHVVQVVSRYSDSWLTGLLCVRACVFTLNGLSPLWVSMCLCSQLWLVDGVLYTLQPFHRHTNTCVGYIQAHTLITKSIHTNAHKL